VPTSASRRRTKRLNSADFPTFGRPTIATCIGMGHCLFRRLKVDNSHHRACTWRQQRQPLPEQWGPKKTPEAVGLLRQGYWLLGAQQALRPAAACLVLVLLLLPPLQALALPEQTAPCHRCRCGIAATLVAAAWVPGAYKQHPGCPKQLTALFWCKHCCWPPCVLTPVAAPPRTDWDCQTRRKDTTDAFSRSLASPHRSSLAEPAVKYTCMSFDAPTWEAHSHHHGPLHLDLEGKHTDACHTVGWSPCRPWR
jgi:hypothetical protein